jgi:hypothetical protein
VKIVLDYVFEARLQKSVLRYIEALGQQVLSKDEKENEGTSIKMYEIFELQERAYQYIKEKR